MTLMLVSTAQKIRADSIKHDDVDLFRAQLSFNQSAYNAIASAVLRTQKLEKFFIGFLFKETPSEPIWSNIIDINQQIRLSDELDRPLITTSLEDFRAISGFRLQKENNSNVSYMASVALSGSSLSQFTLADRILQESNMDESLSGNNLDEAVDTLSESSNTKDTLELDIFNRNPCMRLLTEVIKKLHTEITPPEKELGAMPSWMGEIYRKFNDYGSTLALKLYLAKLIINYPQAFENYASFWLIPLVEIASRGSEFGEPINYFVQDLCTLIITWGRSINPCEKYQDKYALYTFVKVLMGSAYHDHSRILRNNIQIIKGIFDNWGQSIIISTETIYRQFTHTNEDSKKNIVGLQLTGIVLAHGLNPYYNGNGSDLKGLTEFQFYTSMSNNIFGKHLKAVSDTAELMGWSLEYVKKFNHQLYGEMFDLYVKRLTKILHGKDENSNRFIMAVNRVSLHNLDIPRIFLQKVIFKLPQLVGKPLIQAIEIVTACSEDDSKIIQQFNSIGILRVLQYRNDDSQLAILRFLYKLSPVMEEKDFKSILPIIIKLFTSHHNVECRNIYYKILQARYLVSKDDPKIKDELMAALLRGLVDKYLAISDSVYVFIQECNGINDDTNMNITKILREMYLPSLEDIYLLYSTRMILKGTENSYEYDKPVFDKPLPNARFDANYINMNTSWQRSANMTPLFAATQNTVINPEELELNIRATQNSLAFSQTQAAYFVYNSSQAISEGKNDYSQLRKRFIKSGKSSSNFFIRRQEDLQKQLRTYLNVKKETQEKKVTLLRKYRYGELPDIQICYLDLLKPLGLLAGKDYHISRLLYGSLVVATVENESESYKADIISILETNMDRSTLYFTPTIGTFLRICIDLKVTGISSKLVKRVSTRSSNHHMGITLMENVLSHNTEERLKKRSRTTDGIEGNKKKDWINMSLLFKDIDEPEMFESIYQYNVASSDLTQEAIEAETRGQYARAFNLFHKAKSDSLDDALDEERDLWDKEMLHCYEKLLQWGDIANKIEEIIPDRNYECLWDSKYQDPYMSYFIKSFTKLRNQHREQSSSEILPWTDENPNPIFAFLEATYNSNERQKYLIDNYASDVAAAAVMKHKYEYGLEIVRSSYTSLLSVWTMLHPLADSSRKNKLASLERIVELEDYIFLAKDVKQIEMASEKVVKFLNPLYRRSPDAITDSIDIWDDIMETRMMFLEDLSFNLDIESLVSLESTFHQAKRNFLKAMSDAALEQKNSNVVFTKLQALQEMGDHNSFDMGTIKYYQNELENMMIDPTQKNGIIVRALYKSLTYTLPDNSNALQSFDYYISLAKTFDIIKVQIIADPVSFTSLKKSKAITKMAMVASKENSTLHTECIWRFGQYCDSSLKIASNSFGNSPLDINRIKYSTLVVESYMKAMDCGHIEAAKTFPRLLELIELYSEAGEAFRIQSESFSSTWLYIKWIPQLVALLDSSLATYIYPAVQKIAIEYPNALYYPFRISNEQYELIKHELPSINQEIVEKIKNNLKSPIMEEFCLELKRLTDPEHLLKDFIDYLQSIVYDDKINPSFGNDFYHQLDDLLLNISSSRLGSIGKAFAKNHGHQIIRIIGKNGRNLLSSPSEVIKKLQLYLQDVVSNTKSTARNNADLLKSYSPWLASFKGNDYTEKIEVPGQYDGKGKPQPDNHVMISGFDGRLLVMNSMRKPKRICIYGSDGKEYMFLVKGGEDLRLDQRIEQLFSVMNEIVGRNSYCSIYNLRIATYNITPMAGNLGLIEWVNNTIPLRRCIEDQLTNKMQMTRIQDNYRRWIKKHAGSSAKPMDGYQKSFGANRSDVTSTYQQISRQIQPTVLKDYLMKLASSPEAFIFIRRYFAHSLACISIFGYILGIGDRHLENFLLDLSSGRLIPIDFGHAFGSATELLPVPELVPFRMTPQLVGVLEPLGICNLLETPMINLLSAIQANKDLLLNTMTVFVKEPSLDWKKAAIKYSKSKKHISSMDSNKSSFHSKEDVKWYPENKIEIAKRKLDGDNPAYIVTTELTNGHENQFYYDSVTKLARGDTENNIRARVKERCESVKQQVDCLIDLATDPHILGTMWVGWQSFV
ncbi:hypothetical protein BDB01DRAFT_840542 [Pilobolus umbonatus]|nr:hypothetical protein BDB01DRAFT_840542 [Pilobolus umbonatus]